MEAKINNTEFWDAIVATTIADIQRRVGDKIIISLAEASRITGMDPRTMKTDPTFPGRQMPGEGARYIVPVIALAYWICGREVAA